MIDIVMSKAQVLRVTEDNTKNLKDPVRLAMRTKGSFNPCEHCVHCTHLHPDCETCSETSMYNGIMEMQIHFFPKGGKPCGKCLLIKSFYKPTESGIADVKYAICSYNMNSQKDEYCYPSLRIAVKEAEKWLTEHNYEILGYVSYVCDYKGKHVRIASW